MLLCVLSFRLVSESSVSRKTLVSIKVLVNKALVKMSAGRDSHLSWNSLGLTWISCESIASQIFQLGSTKSRFVAR